MTKETLVQLERVNELELTDKEREQVAAFFEKRNAEFAKLSAIDTENVEQMVHVMPIAAALREDKSSQPFSRDDLQKGAPETTDGYWQVPRLVE
ncbi:MAG: Asp-tRNA(Asn)/Glu-tRNA(Gln) amidotransferase subunit GatC [Clostridia bacterium]|nr:Asp-tRNA(Asn)/Glu-tRNA(Gln) amidotransferase subunit GatC [Clostridia bacterium]